MGKRPPHIVVTTPELLYILLSSESGRAMLKTTRAVIVDEIHALAPNKRGSHLASRSSGYRPSAGAVCRGSDSQRPRSRSKRSRISWSVRTQEANLLPIA